MSILRVWYGNRRVWNANHLKCVCATLSCKMTTYELLRAFMRSRHEGQGSNTHIHTTHIYQHTGIWQAKCVRAYVVKIIGQYMRCKAMGNLCRHTHTHTPLMAFVIFTCGRSWSVSLTPAHVSWTHGCYDHDSHAGRYFTTELWNKTTLSLKAEILRPIQQTKLWWSKYLHCHDGKLGTWELKSL